jgi:hypothetical protein
MCQTKKSVTDAPLPGRDVARGRRTSSDAQRATYRLDAEHASETPPAGAVDRACTRLPPPKRRRRRRYQGEGWSERRLAARSSARTDVVGAAADGVPARLAACRYPGLSTHVWVSLCRVLARLRREDLAASTRPTVMGGHTEKLGDNEVQHCRVIHLTDDALRGRPQHLACTGGFFTPSGRCLRFALSRT